MPRLSTDYSKTIIYKLVCNDYEIQDVYVGSTTDFTKRKSAHKSICNNINHKYYNNKCYKIIRENGGFSNWSMLQIEHYPCNNKREAEARERHWFDQLKSNLNTNKPYTSDTEKKNYYIENKDKILINKKKYYEENKDEILINKKNYYIENKDEILNDQKIKFVCSICDGKYTKRHKSTHEKTGKHKNFMNLQLNDINQEEEKE